MKVKVTTVLGTTLSSMEELEREDHEIHQVLVGCRVGTVLTIYTPKTNSNVKYELVEGST